MNAKTKFCGVLFAAGCWWRSALGQAKVHPGSPWQCLHAWHLLTLLAQRARSWTKKKLFTSQADGFGREGWPEAWPWLMASMQRIASLSSRAVGSSVLRRAQRGVHAAVLAEPQFKAVLVDAAGTLIRPSEPAAEVGAHTRQMQAFTKQCAGQSVCCKRGNEVVCVAVDPAGACSLEAPAS